MRAKDTYSLGLLCSVCCNANASSSYYGFLLVWLNLHHSRKECVEEFPAIDRMFCDFSLRIP